MSNSNEKSYQKYKSHRGLKTCGALCSEILLVPAFGDPTPDEFRELIQKKKFECEVKKLSLRFKKWNLSLKLG